MHVYRQMIVWDSSVSLWRKWIWRLCMRPMKECRQKNTRLRKSCSRSCSMPITKEKMSHQERSRKTASGISTTCIFSKAERPRIMPQSHVFVRSTLPNAPVTLWHRWQSFWSSWSKSRRPKCSSTAQKSNRQPIDTPLYGEKPWPNIRQDFCRKQRFWLAISSKGKNWSHYGKNRSRRNMWRKS